MGRNDDCNFAVVRGDKYPMLLGNGVDCPGVDGPDRYAGTVDGHVKFRVAVCKTVREKEKWPPALAERQRAPQPPGADRRLQLHGDALAARQLQRVTECYGFPVR